MEEPHEGGDEEYDADDELENGDDWVGVAELQLKVEYLKLLLEGVVLGFELGESVVDLPASLPFREESSLLILRVIIIQLLEFFSFLDKSVNGVGKVVLLDLHLS